jgi:transcription initiation factor IIE alpha subunit
MLILGEKHKCGELGVVVAYMKARTPTNYWRKDNNRMRRKAKRFSTRLFVSWMIDADRIKEKGKDEIAKDISDYILGKFDWVKQCEGKTEKEMEKMGYVCNDTWLE